MVKPQVGTTNARDQRAVGYIFYQKGATMFKLGQKVWNPDHGWGEVYEILRTGDLPVLVDFGGIAMAFAHNGCATVRSGRPTLFHDEPKDWPNPPAPLPDIAVDTPVWVWHDNEKQPLPRHFAGWQDGGIRTWFDGGTSHTTAAITTYRHWTLRKP